MTRRRTRLVAVLLACVAVLLPAAAGASVPVAISAATPAVAAVPTRDSVLAAARSALDRFYASDGGATADAGWRWAPFFMAAEELHRETGEVRYRDWVQAWGTRNAWLPDAPVSPTSNPDSRAAIQVWHDAALAGMPADLAPSDRLMAADLALPPEQYWWIDAMFMGMPLWPRWAARTGDPAYGARHGQFYDFLKNAGTTRWRPGCTATGLFDETEGLWWRDCRFVAQRDALGNKVFWARGNGWVIAAMARTLMVLPPSDPRYTEYEAMLEGMAGRLAGLQGSDGMWRTNLLSPSLFPAPETSATALFTYAMAWGIRTGVLDAATYLPVVLSAWDGMVRTSLRPSGFLSNCQGVGDAPAAPSTTRSIGYCVGAFGLAAVEVARLTDHLAADSFSRDVAGGLGVAGVGGPWTVTGPAARFGVAGGQATISVRAGSTLTAALPGVVSSDTDVRLTVGVPRPRSGSVYVAVLPRQVGATSYGGRAIVAANGTVQAQVLRAGTTLGAVTVPGLAFTTGDRLWVRTRATGVSPTTVGVKVWEVGTAEPAAWQVEVTDATPALQTTGGIGLVAYLGANAQPTPVVVTLDDLTARRSG